MPAEVHWKGDTAHRSSISLHVDEVGVVNVTETWQCKDEAQANDLLDVSFEDCPLDLTRPYVKATSADRMEANTWQVTRAFSAVLDENLIGQRKTYRCSTVANKEPIQTHPDFTKFAGTAGAPINGAVYDEEGNFERFKPYLNAGDKYTDASKGDGVVKTATSTMKNRKCGVSDYLVPIVHFTETKLVLKEDLAAEVKKLTGIDKNLPDSELRPHWPKRTWLLTKTDPQWAARDVYKLVKEWSLSGPRGWDADVYLK